MATRPKNGQPDGEPQTRIEDERLTDDEKLAGVAGGDGKAGERIEPDGVSAVEREAAASRAKAAGKEPMVRLINMTMGNASLRVPQGGGVVRETVPPFGLTSPLPASYAKRQNRRRAPERKYESNRQTWAQEPDVRPAGYTPESFQDKASGQEFITDSYRPSDNRKTPSGGQYRHSIRQAQLFVAGLKTADAVRRYTRLFDNRTEVLAYAHTVLSARQAAEMKALGIEEGAGSEAMV